MCYLIGCASRVYVLERALSEARQESGPIEDKEPLCNLVYGICEVQLSHSRLSCLPRSGATPAALGLPKVVGWSTQVLVNLTIPVQEAAHVCDVQ